MHARKNLDMIVSLSDNPLISMRSKWIFICAVLAQLVQHQTRNLAFLFSLDICARLAGTAFRCFGRIGEATSLLMKCSHKNANCEFESHKHRFMAIYSSG